MIAKRVCAVLAATALAFTSSAIPMMPKSVSPVIVANAIEQDGWKEAYINYINNFKDDYNNLTYSLIDVNNDDIPELYIYRPFYNYVYQCPWVITYNSSTKKISEAHLIYCFGMNYKPKENAVWFEESYGGYRNSDHVYRIEDGEFVEIGSGNVTFEKSFIHRDFRYGSVNGERLTSETYSREYFLDRLFENVESDSNWASVNESNSVLYYSKDDIIAAISDTVVIPSPNDSAKISGGNVSAVVGKKTTLSFTYTAKDPSNIDDELSHLSYSYDWSALNVENQTYLKNSDNKSALITADLTTNKCGVYEIDPSVWNVEYEAEPIIVTSEPELILPGSSEGNFYNHYSNLTINLPAGTETISKDIRFNVNLDGVDEDYTHQFLDSIETGFVETNDLTAYADLKSSYAISDDGKTAEFILTISCGNSDISNFIYVKTPVQEKRIHLTRDSLMTNAKMSINDAWGFTNGAVDGGMEYKHYTKFFNPIYAYKLLKQFPGQHGVCAGLVTSTIASSGYNAPYADTFQISDNAYSKKLSDVTSVSSKSMGYTAGDLVKYAYAFQFVQEIQDENNNNKNNLNGLYEAIKESIKFNNQYIEVVIRGNYMGNDEGHLLLALDIIKDTDSEVQIRVYDCNNPGDDERILYLTKSDGKITAWEYQIFKSVPTLKWGTGNQYNCISYTTSGNDFAEEMFSTEWLNINNEYHKLLTTGNGDINIISGEIKKMLKINSSSILPDSKYDSVSNNLYWLDSDDPLTFKNGDTQNEVDIASENESIYVNLSPNNTVSLFVSDTDDDYAVWQNLTTGSEFTVDFCDYYDSDDTKYVEKKTTISGVSSSDLKAVNKSAGVEIVGANSFTVTTQVNDKNVDSISIEADNHSVLITKNDDLTLAYKVDTNDDGIYDEKDIINDDSSNTDSSNPKDDSYDSTSSDTDSSSANNDSSSNSSSDTDSSSSNNNSSSDRSSSNNNSSSSSTSSNNNSGSTTSQNNTTTNLDSTSNPKTGDTGTATKAFGMAALMLGLVTVLKKRKQ